MPGPFDRFADIGTPKGMGPAEVGSQAALDGWLAASARSFSMPALPVKASSDTDQELYAEPGEAYDCQATITINRHKRLSSSCRLHSQVRVMNGVSMTWPMCQLLTLVPVSIDRLLSIATGLYSFSSRGYAGDGIFNAAAYCLLLTAHSAVYVTLPCRH